MASKRIWVIEEGNYSDYHVVGVFSTKENAEVIASIVKTDREISEWILDPAVNEIRKGLCLFRVLMLQNGDVELVESREASSSNLGTTPAYIRKIYERPDTLSAFVWAKNEKQAVKIANEKRIQMIANGEWK